MSWSNELIARFPALADHAAIMARANDMLAHSRRATFEYKGILIEVRQYPRCCPSLYLA